MVVHPQRKDLNQRFSSAANHSRPAHGSDESTSIDSAGGVTCTENSLARLPVVPRCSVSLHGRTVLVAGDAISIVSGEGKATSTPDRQKRRRSKSLVVSNRNLQRAGSIPALRLASVSGHDPDCAQTVGAPPCPSTPLAAVSAVGVNERGPLPGTG